MANVILKVQRISLTFHGSELRVEAEYHSCTEKDGMLRPFAAGTVYVPVDEQLAALAEGLVTTAESALNKSWGFSPSEEAEDPERSLTAREDEEPL